MTEELGAQVSTSAGLSPAARRVLAAIGSVVFLAVLVGAWHLAVAFDLVKEIILPFPFDVGQALVDTSQDSFFYKHLWITTQEVIYGFLIGSAIGFTLGALLGGSRWAREIAYPYVVAFQGLPKIVLAPVFITAFGFGMNSKIAMAVAISFFPVLINTMVAFTSLDPNALRLMQSLTASRRHVFMKLAIPHSLPLVFAGLKTGLTLALVGAIVGEFIQTSEGLGYLLGNYAFQLQIARMYAVMIILALLGVILFLALEALDRKLVFWRSERGLTATM
ncbi:MAG: ABC transporter permease [Dehalococcoidia bacterium]